MWVEEGELGEAEVGSVANGAGEKGSGNKKRKTKLKPGETWAVALSEDGRYLAGTSYDGRIGIWDLLSEGRKKTREYETKGSFGMCVDMVSVGLVTLQSPRNTAPDTDQNTALVSGWQIHSVWA